MGEQPGQGMYGLINRAIRDLITSRVGEARWNEVHARASIGDSAFITMMKSSDETTMRLVAAAAEALHVTPEQALEAFGEYWITFSVNAGYGHFLESAGDNLLDFLTNLDNMHTRLALNFPDIDAPSFHVKDVRSGQVDLHYYSMRADLAPFVIGLMKGVGKRFDMEVTTTLLRGRKDGLDHDEFILTFAKCPPLT